MKRLLFLALLMAIGTTSFTQTLKPYILGSTIKQPISEVNSLVKTALKKNGFTIVGEYSPMGDADRIAMVVTHKML